MNVKFKEILKNIYFQIIFGIILGITLLISSIERKGIFVLFGVIGIFLISINLIRLIDTINGKQTDFKSLIIGYLIYPLVLGLFLVINFMGFEQLDKTINGSEIFKNYGLYGVLFAIFIEFIRPKLTKKEGVKFSFSSLLLWLIIFPLLFISSATLLNKYSTDLETNSINSIVLKKEFEIDEQDKTESKFSIYTNIRNFRKEFEVKPELWNNLQKNDSIILFIKNGYLGYEIIDKIEKKPIANIGYN